MKIFKRLALAVVATSILGVSSVAVADGGGRHGDKFEKLANMDEQERLEFMEDRLDKRVQRMQKNLDLTPAQVTKVREILADAQTRSLEKWEANRNVEDKTALRKEVKEIKQQSRKDIRAILTPEQQAKADAMKAERKNKHDKRAGKMKGKMLDRLDEKLDLTDAQEAKIKTILEAKHQKMKALRESETEDKRAAAKQLFEETSVEIEKVLDADQKVKFAAMQEEMKERKGHGKGKGKFQKRHGKSFD